MRALFDFSRAYLNFQIRERVSTKNNVIYARLQIAELTIVPKRMYSVPGESRFAKKRATKHDLLYEDQDPKECANRAYN